jgi:tRNA (mo5U34)-methyltransferase
MYALDKVVKKVAGKMVFQTMIRGSEAERQWEKNYHFWNKEIFSDPDFPCMYFIEQRYAEDPTNWWIPNRGAAEGMLRSAGLEIECHPEPETWVCVPKSAVRDGQYILEMELAGTL